MSVDDVDVLIEGPFEQTGAEGGGDELGVFLRDVAAVGEMAGGGAASVPLGHEKAKSMGQIEIAADGFERFGVDGGHVDRVADFAFGEVVDQELDGFDRDLGLSFFRAGAEVWSAKDVGHAEEGAARAGLFDEDVKGHAADLAAFEAFDERLFVVDAAASRVDEPDTGLHDLEGRFVDEVGGFGSERRVDGEVIDVREHLADGFDAFDAELGGLFGGEEWIVAENAHLEGEGPLGDFLADAAEADNAERLVGELCAQECFAVPFAFF